MATTILELYPGRASYIQYALAQAGIPSSTVALHAGERPHSLEESIILSGGGISVLDNHPVLVNARDIVERAIAQGVPILGICLGHQLLAQLYGGRVAKAQQPERGYIDVSIDNASALTRKLPESIEQFAYHDDEVIVPPKSARTLASSRDCACHILELEHGKVYGVQFHPEITRAEASLIVQGRYAQGRYAQGRYAEGRYEASGSLEPASKRLFRNFASLEVGR